MSERQKRLRMLLLAAAPWTLGIVTLVVLLTNLPTSTALMGNFADLATYVGLAAFSLYFGVLLSEGEFSLTHIVGILALLSSPAELIPALTWAMFVGGCLGSLGWYVRVPHRVRVRTRIVGVRGVVMVVARVTLSFWAAAQVYLAAGGQLPLGSLVDDVRATGVLLIYSLVYTTLYFAIFVLEGYIGGLSVHQIVRVDLARIVVILIVPIPFGVLGAQLLSDFTLTARLVFIIGLLMTVLGLYALSVSEYRVRRQYEELRTLSVVTRSMRTHLDLDSLLRTIYLQVAHLLDVDTFQIVLIDPNKTSLTFPLMMRRGQEVRAGKLASSAADRTLLGHVLATQTPLLLSGRVEERARAMGLRPPDEPVYGWIGLPLQGGRLLGALIVMSLDSDRQFTSEDLRLLGVVVASASIAIDNAQLYQQQVERVEQLATLNRVAGLLSDTLSQDKVLDTVISSGSLVSDAEAVAVYLFGDDGQPPLVRSAGLSDAFNLQPPMPLMRSEQNVGHGHLVREVIVSDAGQEARAAELRSLMQREGKAAWIELPLVRGESLLGVLVLYYERPQEFTGDRIELFKTFANQATQAILNARAYDVTSEAVRRSGEQLMTLSAIGRLLASTIDLREICALILQHATESTKGEVGYVVLLDEQTRRPQIAMRCGDTGQDTQSGFETTALMASTPAQVWMAGQHFCADDAAALGQHQPLMTETQSVLSVPILTGEDILGAITLESKRTQAFSSEDVSFVSQLANQALIAITNARLFKRIADDRNRLQVLLDAMEEGIMLVDRAGIVVLANPRIDLIGLTPESVLGEEFRRIVSDPVLRVAEKMGFGSNSQALSAIAMMDDSLRVNPSVMYVLQGTVGLIHIRRQVLPVHDKDGQTLGVLLVFYNKTEEQELARAREEFSRMIVHDLRSPLAAVTSGLRLISEIVPHDSAHYEMVEMTTDAGRRALRKLLSRVDSLLDVAKMESGQISIHKEPTELLALVENIQAELRPLAQELKIQIEAEVMPTLLPLNVDADKTERVLLNLVDNALKYSPQGGRITVRHHMPGTAGAAAGFVRVDVVDQGPGIPPEYKGTLFDRFVQIEGRRKVRRGVGLGLTFCRMVVEAHEGRIWIEDNPDGGSIFAMTLPLVSLDGIEDDE